MSSKHRWTLNLNGTYIEVRGWPDRPFNCIKVYTEGRVKWARNAKGQNFCNLVQGSGYYGTLGNKAFRVLKGVAMLGGCDKAVFDLINAHQEKAERLMNRGFSANEVVEHAAAAGIKLTYAQQRILKRSLTAAKRARSALYG